MNIKNLFRLIILVYCAHLNASENQNNRLFFTLNNAHKIEAYGQRGDMKFYLPATEFTGKVIYEIVPLDTLDKQNIQNALTNAVNSNMTQEVSYHIKNNPQQFLAKITAMKRLRKKAEENYFVIKIKENPALR